MKGKIIKRVAAFALALTIIGGGIPQPSGGVSLLKSSVTADAADSTAVLDTETGVLTLSGNVVKEDVQAFAKNTAVKKILQAQRAYPHPIQVRRFRQQVHL